MSKPAVYVVRTVDVIELDKREDTTLNVFSNEDKAYEMAAFKALGKLNVISDKENKIEFSNLYREGKYKDAFTLWDNENGYDNVLIDVMIEGVDYLPDHADRFKKKFGVDIDSDEEVIIPDEEDDDDDEDDDF